MKSFLLSIVVLVCLGEEILALSKCPTIPTLDLEQVNLDQVKYYFQSLTKLNRSMFFYI
jgi:hypothetical protein